MRRPRTALAHDPAEGRDPAEPLVRVQHPVTFDAAIDLGPHAQLVEQVHLVPARDATRRHRGVEQLVCPAKERVQRLRGMALLEAAIGELGEVPGRRRGLERIAQVQPGMLDADLGHDVEGAATSERDGELGEWFEAAADPRRRAADPLGDDLELAGVRRDDGQDPIRFPEIEP